MQWYLVQTKPRQEKCALENLQRQGYDTYLPMFSAEKWRQGALQVVDEPLFSRYLFVRLGQGHSAQSWAPIRSTRGVSRLVTFGTEPARVSDGLIVALRERERQSSGVPNRLFSPGDRVRLTEEPFAGVEGMFQMTDGERRAMVLIEMLSTTVQVVVSPGSLKRVG